MHCMSRSLLNFIQTILGRKIEFPLSSLYLHTPLETNGICGKSVAMVNMTLPYVNPGGTRYRCTSKNPIKQVSCTPRCVVNNKRRCNCRPKEVPPKRRKFVCVACSDDVEPKSIEVSLEVKITTRCICFECCQNTNTLWSCAIYRYTWCYLYMERSYIEIYTSVSPPPPP